MYGMVNSAIKEYVKDTYGAAIWENDFLHSKVRLDKFINLRPYSDEETIIPNSILYYYYSPLTNFF